MSMPQFLSKIDFSTTEGLDLFLTAVNAIVVLVGVAFAVYNLRLIRKQQYFEAFTHFMDDMAATEPHRSLVLTSFPERDNCIAVTDEQRQAAKEVINFLNRTAALIDAGMLPKKVVLSLGHTVFLRCWYKLEPYCSLEEARWGGRYGRRVAKLAGWARNFHDYRAHQRVHAINIVDLAGNAVPVHQTEMAQGWKRRPQLLLWFVKDRLRYY